MLVNVLRSAKELVARYEENKRNKENAQTELKNAILIDQSLNNLNNQIDLCQQMAISGIVDKVLTSEVKSNLTNGLEECREAIECDCIGSDTNTLIENPCKNFKEVVGTAWLQQSRNKGESLVGSLKQLKSLMSNPRDVDLLITNIRNGYTTIPSKKEQITNFATYVNNATKELDKLSAPDNVKAFVGRITSGGVTLEELNNAPECMEWLKTHKLLKKIKISFDDRQTYTSI